MVCIELLIISGPGGGVKVLCPQNVFVSNLNKPFCPGFSADSKAIALFGEGYTTNKITFQIYP